MSSNKTTEGEAFFFFFVLSCVCNAEGAVTELIAVTFLTLSCKNLQVHACFRLEPFKCGKAKAYSGVVELKSRPTKQTYVN